MICRFDFGYQGETWRWLFNIFLANIEALFCSAISECFSKCLLEFVSGRTRSSNVQKNGDPFQFGVHGLIELRGFPFPFSDLI